MNKNIKVIRKLQHIIGNPSNRIFIQYIQNKKIPNFSVDISDINTPEEIFGPYMGSIRGKKSRSKPKPVEIHYTKISEYIM